MTIVLIYTYGILACSACMSLINNFCFSITIEWIVIQLCKMYNKNQWYSLRKEYYSSPEPLSITLFCYPRSEIYNNQPITFHLHSRSKYF